MNVIIVKLIYISIALNHPSFSLTKKKKEITRKVKVLKQRDELITHRGASVGLKRESRQNNGKINIKWRPFWVLLNRNAFDLGTRFRGAANCIDFISGFNESGERDNPRFPRKICGEKARKFWGSRVWKFW